MRYPTDQVINAVRQVLAKLPHAAHYTIIPTDRITQTVSQGSDPRAALRASAPCGRYGFRRRRRRARQTNERRESYGVCRKSAPNVHIRNIHPSFPCLVLLFKRPNPLHHNRKHPSRFLAACQLFATIPHSRFNTPIFFIVKPLHFIMISFMGKSDTIPPLEISSCL